MTINELEKSKALQRYILKHPQLQIKENMVECTLCKISMIYVINRGLCNLSKHITSKKHIKNISEITSEFKIDKIITSNIIEMKNDTKIIESVCDPNKRCVITDDEFDSQLVHALISADIPLSRLGNVSFSQFLQRHTNRVIKSEIYYRKILRLYEKKLNL